MQQPKKYKLHLKKADLVKVIAGNDKNKTGKVLFVDTKKRRAIVEGMNVRVFHIKPSQIKPKGGRKKKEVAIDISNLMVIEPVTQVATKTGRKRNDQGKLQRYAKKTGNFM